MAQEEITIKHLAERLDIASSTVSRALAGSGGVGEAKAREIRRLAKEMGYRSRPLRRKNADAIGLLIVSDNDQGPDDPYHYEFIYAINRAFAGSQWHLHVELVGRDDAAELPSVVSQRRVDGVMISGHPSPAFCKRIIDAEMPAVVLDDLTKRVGCACVISDIATQTAAIVQRMVDVGHRRFAYVTAPEQYPTVLRRLEGFLSAIQQAGLKAAPDMVAKVPRSAVHAGQVAVRQIFAHEDRPTVVFFATDRLAIGGLIELARLGLSVPADVSVVGHDNTLMARETEPPLTSVDLDVNQTVAAAMELLKTQIDSGEVITERQVEVPARTIWRASSGSPPRAESK